MGPKGELEFDVLLSFAGPEREYARAIHDIANANGLRVFLDEEFQHEIWGENLVEYLDHAYRERGAYVLVLISGAYRERAFTRVERRAAFDRMIQDASAYLLPVKVDESWLDGLPTSTAYIDLRIVGVLGVCELLVRKIGRTAGKLIIPPGVFVPRIPLGCLPADHLAKYLMELCARPQVTAFGALIYDEKNAALRKLLRDRDYWDALDMASGPNLEVFALRDTEGYEAGPPVVEMITAASMSRSRSRGFYFSRLLKDYFGKDKMKLAYPSFVLFLVERGSMRYCCLIPFSGASIDEIFVRLSALFSAIASGIDEAGGPMAAAEALWENLKAKLLSLDYTVYIQHPPHNARDAVRKLTAYVE